MILVHILWPRPSWQAAWMVSKCRFSRAYSLRTPASLAYKNTRQLCSSVDDDTTELSTPRGSRGTMLRALKRRRSEELAGHVKGVSDLLRDFSGESDQMNACDVDSVLDKDGAQDREFEAVETVNDLHNDDAPVNKDSGNLPAEEPPPAKTEVAAEKLYSLVSEMISKDGDGGDSQRLSCRQPTQEMFRERFSSTRQWNRPVLIANKRLCRETTVLPLATSRVPYSSFPRRLIDAGRKVLNGKDFHRLVYQKWLPGFFVSQALLEMKVGVLAKKSIHAGGVFLLSIYAHDAQKMAHPII